MGPPGRAARAVVAGDRFALSNEIWKDVPGVERFRAVTPARVSRGRPGGFLAAVVAVLVGVAVCCLGTALHGHVAYAGSTPPPWGAVLAVVLCGSAATAVGLWSRSLWAAAVAGALAFSLNWLLTTGGDGAPLIVTHTAEPTGVATAGLVWVYGAGVATIAAVVLTASSLRRARR